jgi:hypothetical protein
MVDPRVDGEPVTGVPAASEFQELGIVVPASAAPGARIDLNISPVFLPGGADTRALGVQIDRLSCRPHARYVRPPANAVAFASLAAGAFAAALALLGLSLTSAIAVAVVISLGQTLVLSLGGGIYGDYPATLPRAAAWIALATFGIGAALEIARGQRLTSTARFVFACSSAALYLKILGLLHPAKPVIDAMFHGHRLGRVLAGDWYFTQPMPDGVTFPYAIGVYLFAAPWAWLTTDYMSLMRIVTATADVAAGALMYPLVVLVWRERRAAALAVVLYQLVPLAFPVLGNANLANIFAQSAALAATAAIVLWRPQPRQIWRVAGVTGFTALALCSHVSTVTTLPATIAVFAMLTWWKGDREARASAWTLVGTTAAALAFAWLTYYQHFIDVYRTAIARMFEGGGPGDSPAVAEAAKGYMNYGERVGDLLQQAVANAGWPLLALAAIGVWNLWRRRTRDPLVNAIIAWLVVWTVFSASTVFSPVDREFVRYAAEFLGRLNLATMPLLAIVAARGAAMAWEPGDVPLRRGFQWLTAILLASALALAVRAWSAWL